MPAEKFGPESIAADLTDPRPETPARMMKDKGGYTDAAHSGYTCLQRRPLSNLPGEWTDIETADRIDALDSQLGPMPSDY